MGKRIKAGVQFYSRCDSAGSFPVFSLKFHFCSEAESTSAETDDIKEVLDV